MKKVIVGLVMFAVVLVMFFTSGCTEAERVTQNVSQDADNFNVMRRLAVINTVEGKPVFELVGRFSITADSDDKQLEVVVETDEGKYKKHIIGLNDATTMYVVEDVNGANVSRFHYEINFLPEAINPIKIVRKP